LSATETSPREGSELAVKPHQFPFHKNDCSRLQVASQSSPQFFYEVVEDILHCKEQDKRIAKTEISAIYG